MRLGLWHFNSNNHLEQQSPQMLHFNKFLSFPPAASSLLMVVNETAKEMREGRRRTEFLLKGISISGKSPLGYVEQQIHLEAFFKKVNVAL